MKIKDIINLLNAKIITQDTNLDKEIRFGFASDLMSDVLTLDEEDVMLITGLCNIQTIRTVEMANIAVVLFVRDKTPNEEMIELAKEENLIILKTSFSMFKTCGILFQASLDPIY